MENLEISGNLVDIIGERIFPAKITVENGKISKIERASEKLDEYLIPGFVDSHIHIESSMLPPAEFARLAVVHGTVATVSDPHEIANVLGIEGVNYMIKNGEQVPFKFYFGAPSCVPATPFETSGAEIGAEEIERLLKTDKIKYLSEMMNFPGVLNGAPDVTEKIELAEKYGKPSDGHSPGLQGEEAKKYVSAGISADHECFSMREALDKISYGMKIQIREGSAAKNFDELYPLMDTHNEMTMLCSDDKHPDDLVAGHINLLVKKAVARGVKPMDALKSATLNPVTHYNLDVGLLREGDDADFILIDNLKNFGVIETYVKGNLVARKRKSLIESVDSDIVNNFKATSKTIEDFQIEAESKNVRAIGATDGDLTTKETEAQINIENGKAVSNVDSDILKIAVVNRYENAQPAIAFIKNFGLKKGAIATSVAHDSHNIIATGVEDEDILLAVNSLIKTKGGMAVASDGSVETLPLPIAGLMTDADGYETAAKYKELTQKANSLGSKMSAPFMTLSFMALLVIPKLKLSDKGLFDGEKFEFVDLFKS